MKGGLYNRIASALVLLLAVCVSVRLASWLISGALELLIALVCLVFIVGFLIRGRRI